VTTSRPRSERYVPRHRAVPQPLPPRRAPRVVRVARALVGASVLSAVVGGMVGTSVAGRVGLTDATWQQDRASETVEDLIAEHACWQGAAPADRAGVVPGHVVVSPSAGAPAILSADLVDEALSHLFETPRAGMTVYAFCP
jgi:hypothetical protein